MTSYLIDQFVLLINTPLTIILLLLEIFVSAREERHYYQTRDTMANFFLGASFIGVDVLSRGAGLAMLAAFSYIGVHWAPGPAHAAAYWISLLVLEDFAYWFMHLLDHRVRFLWAGHIHHHSSQEFNLSVGLRSAVFEPIERFFFFIPLAAIGYRPVDILAIYVLAQGWGTFVHTRTIKKLGFLEYFLTTPSHHRVHHGRNVKYLDRNYGMFLIIWDKLFGTFQPEDPAEPVDFGIYSTVQYRNYLDIIFHEYRQILKDLRQKIPWRQKLGYLFGPPGYSHDGSRQTSRQLQNEMKAQQASDNNPEPVEQEFAITETYDVTA